MVSMSRIMELVALHRSEYRKTENTSPFIEGLILMRSRSGSISDPDDGFQVAHDVFYGYMADELHDLTEDDVLALNRLGWHLNDEHGCFAYFV